MAVHPCPMCKRLIPVGITYCDSCRPEAEARAAAAVERKRKQYNRTYNKRRDPKYLSFYRSKEWRLLSRTYLQAAGYTCEAGLATGVGTSYSWTVPDVASSIPSATSGRFRIRAITYSGSKSVGTKYVYLTGNVPSSVVPTVGTISVSEATSGLNAQFGAYIQGKTKLAVRIAASGAKGSTITAYSTTLAGKTYTGSSWTSPVLTNKGSIQLVTKVKDSRGRWSASKTTTVSLLAYSAPQVTKLQAYRVNSAGTADEEGQYLRLDYAYSVTSLNSKNTASAVVEYKRCVDTSWTTLLTDTALSANKSVKPATPTFSVDNSYDLRLTVTDWFGTARAYTASLPSGAVILDIKADGKGIAFGKTAEAAGIDFGWNLTGSSATGGSGIIHLGKYLIQWGGVSITPTAANTPTTEIVTFATPFTATPAVFATPVSSVPETLSVAVQRSTDLVGDNKAKVAITLTRSGTTTTGINWLAIGPG